MTRFLLSFGSALVLISAYFLLAGGGTARAADGERVIAPGNPPLTRDVADASAQVTVFMLKVVATGTATASDLNLDPDLLDEWADAMAAEHGSLSADEQQQLAIMPVLRGALQEAWPQASSSERADLRDAFRPIAQGWLGDVSCATFVDLADGGLVEKTAANISRYRGCDDEDEADSVVAPTTSPAPVAAAPAPVATAPAPVASAPTQAAPSVPSVSPTAAYQRASAGLQASHNMYVNMSNVLLENHVGNMNAILNMGNNNYHYVYSKP